MAFEKFVKKNGRASGDYVSFSARGCVTLNNIKNIEKYKSIQIYVDRERYLIGMIFFERERSSFEKDSFPIYKNSTTTYSTNISAVFKNLSINISEKSVLLPYETVKKMYVFDFSKFK